MVLVCFNCSNPGLIVMKLYHNAKMQQCMVLKKKYLFFFMQNINIYINI